MDAAELNRALEKLGMTRLELADVIGTRRTAPDRWCRGETPIPGPARRLVKLMLRSGAALEALRAIQADEWKEWGWPDPS